MSRGEFIRRAVSTFFYLSVLSLLLATNATKLDYTEGKTLLEMALIVGACEATLWYSMRRPPRAKGRIRFELACACALLVLLPRRPVDSVEASSVPELRRTMEEVTWLRTA